MEKLKELTDKLSEVRRSIEDVDAQYDEVMKPLTAEKTLLEFEIIKELKGQGLHATPESHNGDYFIKSAVTNYKVVDEEAALKWGLKNGAVALDKTKTNTILKRFAASKLPKCFAIEDKDKLTIKRPLSLNE